MYFFLCSTVSGQTNLGYERVYLPLCKVADTPFHIQGGDIFIPSKEILLHVKDRSRVRAPLERIFCREKQPVLQKI